MTTMLKTSGKPDSPHVCHLPELTTEECDRLYGTGTVEMADVVTAGEMITAIKW